MNFNSSLTDPLVLICIGVLVIGLVFLFWAIGRLRKKSEPVAEDYASLPEDSAPISEPVSAIEREEPPMRAQERAPTPAPAPVQTAATREVAERLDLMAQRLADMQNVLSKAAVPQVGPGPAGAMGQGFSPETIDKLLKIIGNVIQQVDILQKSMDLKPSTPPPGKAAPVAPPPISNTPGASGVITGSPGMRGAGGPITGPQSQNPPKV